MHIKAEGKTEERKPRRLVTCKVLHLGAVPLWTDDLTSKLLFPSQGTPPASEGGCEDYVRSCKTEQPVQGPERAGAQPRQSSSPSSSSGGGRTRLIIMVVAVIVAAAKGSGR